MAIPLAAAALWTDRALALADIGVGGKQFIDGVSHGDPTSAAFGAGQMAWGIIPGSGLLRTALKGKKAVDASKAALDVSWKGWAGRGLNAAYTGIQLPTLMSSGGGIDAGYQQTLDPAVETVMRGKMAELSDMSPSRQGESYGGSYDGRQGNLDPIEAYRNRLMVDLIS